MLLTADRRELAAIFAGGFAGTVARSGLVEAWAPAPSQWPWPIFLVNLAGAFILGFALTWFRDRDSSAVWRERLVGTGFCGALTTFSTMQLELLLMLDGGHLALAAGYAGASVVAGFGAVEVGARLAARSRVEVAGA